MKFKHTTLFFATALILLNACSNEESMNVIDLKTGETIGVLSISKHQNFVVVVPKIHSLPPGLHGFHLHQTNDCRSTTEGNRTILGGAAGSHFTNHANQTNHLGPWQTAGHAGDLSNLFVDAQGLAQTPMITNKLKLDDFRNGAVMIHANPDNYTNKPKLGGSGARIACALLSK